MVSRGTFGIEFEWLAAEREPTVSYHFRVRDQALGTAGLERSLSAAHADMTQLLRHEGNRQKEAWLETPRARLLGQLEAALIVDFDSAVDPGPQWDAHSRFVAFPVEAPAFMGWSGFLIEAGGAARLVWAKHERRAVVREERLLPGDFEATLKEFRAVLEQRSSSRHSAPPTSGERVIGMPSSSRSAATKA